MRLDVIARPCKTCGAMFTFDVARNATRGKRFTDLVNCQLHRKRNGETKAQTAARVAGEQAARRPVRRGRLPGPKRKDRP